MRKSGLTIIVFIVLLALWTLLAWGVGNFLGWVSAQAATGGMQDVILREGALLPVPQEMLNVWLAWLQGVWGWLSVFAPGVIFWLGYIIWILWGLGVALLLVLVVAGNRLINFIRHRLVRVSGPF